MFIQKNKYKVLRGAISKELASVLSTNYFLKKRKVARFLFDYKYIYHHLTQRTGEYGTMNKFPIVILIIQ